MINQFLGVVGILQKRERKNRELANKKVRENRTNG
jgi:hypothetical protein